MRDFFDSFIKHNTFFFVFGAISILMIVASFVIPPTGVIDPSAIGGSGVLFGWAALGAVLKAMDNGKTAKIRHGETELTLGDHATQSQDY